MKNLSTAFRQALYNDDRNYTLYVDITLADNTKLYLTNSDIWTGGFSYEEAVSSDSEFTALGSAIIGSARIVINNIYETYTPYDFTDATVVLQISKTFEENNSTRLEKFPVGTYTVDDVTYNGATITLMLLDNMVLFDKPYTASSLIYPATLYEIVNDACGRCSVILDTLSFPHSTFVINEAPTEDSITFREVLSWVATIAGCYLKCTPEGHLKLAWFDQTTLSNMQASLDGGTFDPWSGGEVYSGGTFSPWSGGSVYDGGVFTSHNIHHISDLFSQNVSMDDVVITKVLYELENKSEATSADIISYYAGTDGYTIQLQNNGFITSANAQTIINWLGAQLIGLKFRPLSITHMNNPAIESGDIAVVTDRKQNMYFALVTRTEFSADGNQTTVCGAATPLRNSGTRFTQATKNFVEARKLVKVEQTARQIAVNNLAQAISAHSGLYYDEEVTASGSIYYLHDKPNLSDSSVVMKITSEAVAMTDEYNAADPDATNWKFGIQVNGDVIARILSADGINADWINAGAISIKDAHNNETFYANTQTGVVRIAAQTFSLTGASIKSSWSGNEIPTNTNEPAVNWITESEKIKHLNDVYYDDSGTGIYKYSKTIEGLQITFTEVSFSTTSSASVTNSIVFDYENETYIIKNPLTAGLSEATVFIPSTKYWVYLSTDVTYSAKYTITKIYDVFPTNAVIDTPPTADRTFTYSKNIGILYSDNISTGNESRLYKYTVITTISNNPIYTWLLVDTQDLIARSNSTSALNTAASAQAAVTYLDTSLNGIGILNRITDSGAIQGAWGVGNKFYINFESARGGTLFLGGVNNGYGLLRLYNNQGELTSEINNEYAIFANPDNDYHIKIQEGRMIVGVDETLWPPYQGSRYSVASIGMNDVSDEISAGGSMPSWHTSSDNTFVIDQERSSYSIIIRGNSAVNSRRTGIEVDSTTIYMNGSIYINGSYWVTAAKGRIVENTRYGTPTLYCYETPTPYFGDIGVGQTDDTGEAIISIDDIFDETVNTKIEYCVFLQKEGAGDIWVDEKESTYFVVKGTPNLKFSWEIKAVQKGFENLRLDDDNLRREDYVPVDDIDKDLDAELAEYDKEMEELFE